MNDNGVIHIGVKERGGGEGGGELLMVMNPN